MIGHLTRVALNTTNITKHHKPTQSTTNQTTKPLKPKLIVGYICSDFNWGRKCAGGPNFCILEFIFLFFTFFISSDVKNCQILKKILPFLHFYSVKSYNFCYFFFSDPNMFQIKSIFFKSNFYFNFLPPPTLIL